MLSEKALKRITSKVFFTTLLVLCPLTMWAQNENVFMHDNAVWVKNNVRAGFQLLSSNTKFPVVLAYGDNSSFPKDSLPPHINAWLEGYQEMVELYKNSPGQVMAWLEASKTNTPAVKPLLGEVEWGQDYPYNLNCPKVDSKQCPSGCVATALAQVMNYHQWPLSGLDCVKTYQTSTHHIPITFDFSTTEFLWDRMYDHYDSQSTDVEQIAMLLEAVGAAVEMDYAPKGSGTSDKTALQGMITYLGYDHDMYVANPDEFTDEQWHRLLQQELQEGRPVYYSGSASESGHAFVIDGMKTDEKNGLTYYHVNWGWDGLCNGYYLLNMLRPSQAGTGGQSGANYATRPSMIIGMKPDDGFSQPNYIHCKSLDMHTNELFPGQCLSLRLSRLVLRGNTDFKGSMKVEMRSIGEAQVEPVVLYEEKSRTITKTRGLTNYYMPAILPKDTHPGIYEINIVLRDENGEEMQIDIERWPQLTVKDVVSWIGGSSIQPRQYVAAKGSNLCFEDSTLGKVCFTIDTLCNMSSARVTGLLSLIICGSDSSLIRLISEPTHVNIGGYGEVRGCKIGGIISRYIPNGNYLLGIAFLPDGNLQWSYIYEMTGDDDILWYGNAPLLRAMDMMDGRITIGDYEAEGAETQWESSIHEVTITGESDSIYSLNGFYVSSGHTHHISKGIYVRKVNRKWKKVVID